MGETNFWAQVFERAVKTFAQVALALLSADGLNLLTVNWVTVGVTAGLAFVVSVLTSIATGSASIGQPNSPSAVPIK